MVLSVIIPNYNDGKYLNKALRSVFGQSFQDYEVILVDDGSTDRSAFYYGKWQEQHDNLRVIEQEHQGASIARRNGIMAAKGKYCVFLDADDWFCDTTALEYLVRQMEENNADVLQFLIGKSFFGKRKSVFGKKGEITRDQFWERDCSTLLGGKTWEISAGLCDKIYHTAIFQKAMTENKVESISLFDNIYLNLLFFTQEEVQHIAYVPKLLYSWRQYSGGTFRCDESLMEDYEVLKPLQLQTIEKMGLQEAFRKQCHVETAYLFSAACTKAVHHRKVTVPFLQQMYQYSTVQDAIIYFSEHPNGLWDVIWDFMNTDEEKLRQEAQQYNKNWKSKAKGLYIRLFCRK